MNESKELLKSIGYMIKLSNFENKEEVNMEEYEKNVKEFEILKANVSDVKKAVNGIASLTKDEIVSLISDS